MTLAPSTSCRNAFATAPSATRAAVSRAEARSRIGRDSSKPYFCMPGEVGVPGARAGQRRVAGLSIQDLGVNRIRGHHLDPLRPLAVAHLDRDRAAHGAPVPHAADHADLVGLELHPGAAPDAEAPALQLTGDVGGRDRDIGRHALEHADEGLAVRLAGGQPSKHCPILSRPRMPTGRRSAGRPIRCGRTATARDWQDPDNARRSGHMSARASGQDRAASARARRGSQPIETESPSQTTAFWSP